MFIRLHVTAMIVAFVLLIGLYTTDNYIKHYIDDPEKEEFLKGLYEQATELRTDILPRIGFNNVYHQEGKEADDLLANIVLYHDAVLIISGDTDLYQLLDLCDIWHPTTNSLWTAAKFHKTYGVHPEMWAHVKAVGGCSSDDIPGVKGVGEKMAIKFLTKTLGEHTKAFKAIKENDDLIKRNLTLTELPIGGPRFLPIKADALRMDEFKLLCEELWFDSFLNDDWFYWERFFEGEL